MSAREGEKRMPEPARKSHWKPWLIVFLSGIVLGGSSCAGLIHNFEIHFLSNSHNTLLAALLFYGFVIGVVATLVGGRVLGIMLVIFVFRTISESSF
jgi:hypothetical protein